MVRHNHRTDPNVNDGVAEQPQSTSPADRLYPHNRRRRSSVSPPRSSNSHHGSTTRSQMRSVVRSTQRNPGLVTPPTAHHPRLDLGRGRHMGLSLAPLDDDRNNNHQDTTNQNNNNNNNSSRHSRTSGWLGLTSRSPRGLSAGDHSGRSPSTRRRRLGGLRQGSLTRLLQQQQRGDNSESSSHHHAEVNIREVPPAAASTTRPRRRNSLGQDTDSTRRRRTVGTEVVEGSRSTKSKSKSKSSKSSKSSTKDEEQARQEQLQLTSQLQAQKIRKHHILQMTRRLQAQHSKRFSGQTADVLAILEFWRTTCPPEVTLKMLAFLGPQLVQKLQRTQRHVYHLLQYDVSWRVLCEELYKWKPEDPTPHTSWKDHYRFNPCVPVDFSNIGLALAVVGSGWTPKQYKKYCKSNAATAMSAAPEIQQNVTVWLRPRPEQAYPVAQAICITTLRRTTQVTVRTMHTTTRDRPNITSESGATLYEDAEEGQDQAEGRAAAAEPVQPEECHPDSLLHDNNNDDDDDDDSSLSESDDDESQQINRDHSVPVANKSTMALIQSKTRRRNEPLFRVLRGQLILREVAVEHSCLGVDIWNGNAAIQIQPTYLHSASSTSSPMVSLIPSATAVIEDSSIQSLSGRGIVTVDGGQLFSKRTYVHNCAATGVYIGGRGSSAILKQVDVWSNGVGNPQLAGGIARGHSGVYVEQAKSIELHECSVAYNTASGISMIGNPVQIAPVDGADAATSIATMQLTMSRSHILANGSSPIDLPHGAAPLVLNGEIGAGGGEGLGAVQQYPWQHASQENRIALVGVPQAQSTPLLQELQRQKELKKQQALDKKKRKLEKRQRKKAEALARQQSLEHSARELDWNATPPWT